MSDPYQMAMKLLSYRWRSEEELRSRLAKRDVDPGEIDATIRRLSDEGWIDDERFAKEYVRSRARRHGRRRIGDDLRRFGIDGEAVTEALSEELSQETEDEVLRAAAMKKMAALSRRHGNEYTASQVGRRKLAQFLLNRGYPAVAVRKAVFELTSGVDDETTADPRERDE